MITGLFIFVIGYITFQQFITTEDSTSQGVSFNNESMLFDFPPVDMDKVVFIEPLGGIIGEHVTLIDHQYYVALDHLDDSEEEVVVEVYSPADGFVTEIQHMNTLPGREGVVIDDYRLVIQHPSSMSSKFMCAIG